MSYILYRRDVKDFGTFFVLIAKCYFDQIDG